MKKEILVAALFTCAIIGSQNLQSATAQTAVLEPASSNRITIRQKEYLKATTQQRILIAEEIGEKAHDSLQLIETGNLYSIMWEELYVKGQIKYTKAQMECST